MGGKCMETDNKRFAGFNCIPNSLCEQDGCELCEYSVVLEEEEFLGRLKDKE
jgi:hypothetical protein